MTQTGVADNTHIPLQLIEKGYRVFPVRRDTDVSLDKTPLTPNGVKNATSDREQVERWARKYPDCNWGIACSNVIVFDVDRHEKRKKKIVRTYSDEEMFEHWNYFRETYHLPPAPEVVTGSGGRHYYYRRPYAEIKANTRFHYRRNGKEVKTNIDIKVGNGYVVAPGSINADGNPYQCEDLWGADDLNELPADFVEILPKKGQTAAPVCGQAADVPLYDFKGEPAGHFDKEVILSAARGREVEIYRDVAGIPADILDGKHHSCPKCGGKDRFRVMVEKPDKPIFCNKECFGKRAVDVIGAVEQLRGVSFDEACSLIGAYLGLSPNGTPAKKSPARTPTAKPTAVYDYPDKDGKPAYQVRRFDTVKDGERAKDIRQFTFFNGGWKSGVFDTPGAKIGTPKRIPFPYQYQRLMGSEVKTVFIVEGEKCVERLQSVLNAVEQSEQYAVSTLAGGSNMMRFWGDYADKLQALNVFILPDNDEPGRVGASAAVEGLSDNGVEVTVIPFDGKPYKYDIADWVDEQRASGLTDKEIGEVFLKTFPAKGRNGIEWVDGLTGREGDEDRIVFPIEYFPDFFRDYCEAVARVVAVDVSFPAYALLSGAAYATAYRATFSYRHYDKERLFFHSMLVAHSGAGKSPVWGYMLFPLDEMEERIRVKNQSALSEWGRLSKAEQKKTSPPKLELSPIVHKPTIERIEQAVSIIWEQSQGLDDLKQGIFLPYDEGAYLLGAMNAYKGNGAKSDESALIPMMDGQGGGSDRVGLDANGMPTSRYFADCHITIYATVQNDILKSITKDKPQFFQQGFLQRFAFSVPPFVPKKPLSETEVFDRDLKREYRLFFNRLFKVGGNLTLTREAEKTYLEYEARKTADYNARGELGEARSGFDSVCLSLDRKGMKQVLEVAALLNVLDAAADTESAGTDALQINAREMEGAIKVMEFRERNFHRLYQLVGAEEQGRTLEQRIEQAIEEAGSAGLTLRSLTRKFFQGKRAETVKEFMQELLENNPKIKKSKGRKGGDTYIIQA